MMLYPPVANLVDKVGSKYQLVNLVAHRARNISIEAEREEEPLEEKPVSIAINEVYTGRLTMKTPDPELVFGTEEPEELEESETTAELQEFVEQEETEE